MKLTEKEQKICDKYSTRDSNGFVHCKECPLRSESFRECLANMDGRTKEAKEIRGRIENFEK